MAHSSEANDRLAFTDPSWRLNNRDADFSALDLIGILACQTNNTFNYGYRSHKRKDERGYTKVLNEPNVRRAIPFCGRINGSGLSIDEWSEAQPWACSIPDGLGAASAAAT
ncbi:hypothetical protein [Methylobacterium nigriterrae]|uniref:hypothetical protein n=1 Tax=Methylobacterium nigriterrae TaxID=3127512 RepID=UPI00301356C7